MRQTAEHASASAFLELVSARRGHFRLESGYHSALWLELDDLFTDSVAIAPFVDRLVTMLRSYQVSAACGPLLGGAFLAQSVARALDAEFWYTTPAPADAAGGLYRARYTLPASLAKRATGRRVALVDDVVSAGSSLRATFDELQRQGARPVVAGTLLLLGSVGAELFTQHNVPIEAVARDDFTMWRPDECPLCASGSPIQDTGNPSRTPP
jgi:orotate phosphoribosyltransferase